MSPVHADQLPPEVRKRLGLNTGRTRKAPSRAGIGHSVDCPGHCGCGAPFDRYSDWERHAKTVGCRHWRLDLPIIRSQRDRQPDSADLIHPQKEPG